MLKLKNFAVHHKHDTFKFVSKLFNYLFLIMSSTDDQHGLKDILSLLMRECDIDDAQLARETGVPASTISRMKLNSNANPTASTLRPISKFFSISISQLLGDEALPEDRLPGTHHPTRFTSARIPIIEWDWTLDWIENRCEKNKEKLLTWISTEKEVCHNTFALVIPTDSLGLAFRKSSIIIIDPSKPPVDGDMILIKNHEEKNIFLKQFLIDGSDPYIRSVNPEMKGITQLSENHQIIGVVIEVRFSLDPVRETTAQKKLKFSVTNHIYPKPA